MSKKRVFRGNMKECSFLDLPATRIKILNKLFMILKATKQTITQKENKLTKSTDNSLTIEKFSTKHKLVPLGAPVRWSACLLSFYDPQSAACSEWTGGGGLLRSPISNLGN